MSQRNRTNDDVVDEVIKTSPLFQHSAGRLEDLFGDDKQELLLAELIRLMRTQVGEEYETVTQQSTSSQQKQTQYVSRELTVSSKSKKTEWKFNSDKVVLKGFDEPIDVVFTDNITQDSIVTLQPADAPFELPLSTDVMHYVLNEDAVDDETNLTLVVA